MSGGTQDVRDLVEIGMGRTARRSYELDDVEIVPSRRTRSSQVVSTGWQIDAYRFDIPLITHPSDAIVSPDIAVAVGVADYRTAMHLMRTGAAGVIVGYGHSAGATSTDTVLGIGMPMATAIVDAAAARRDYLDETGGRYVHVIADGGVHVSGDIAKAVACGADAVMLGEPLAAATEMPGQGLYWTSAAAHPSLPRSRVSVGLDEGVDLKTLLFGPASDAEGRVNL